MPQRQENKTVKLKNYLFFNIRPKNYVLWTNPKHGLSTVCPEGKVMTGEPLNKAMEKTNQDFNVGDYDGWQKHKICR